MRENPLMTLKDEISLDPGEVQRRVEWEAFELQRWCLKLNTENAQLNAHSCVALYRGWSDCGSVLLIEESVIPKDLTEEAQTFFEDMTVKLEWPDLYNSNVNILNVQRHEYSLWRTQITDCSSRWRVDSGEELYSLIPKRVQERHKNKTTAGFN